MTGNPPTDSKRSESRLTHDFTVFVESHFAPGENSTSGIVVTKSVDVSANGVQIALDYPLPLQSFLRLCLESSDGEAPFMLTGEVIWLRPAGQQTLVGFQLAESSDTDIIRWKEYIARCLLAGL